MNGRAGLTMRSPELGFALALAMAGVLAVGCDATRRDWRTCHQSKCGPGYVCTIDHQCVPVLDGGVGDASWADAPQGLDGPAVVETIDGSTFDLASPVDTGDDMPLSVQSVDGAAVVDLDAQADIAAVGAFDVGTVDASPADAPGTCASDNDCFGKDAPYCVQGRCASCKTSEECNGGAPVCSASHACVSCVAVDAGCPAATPACEVDSGRCLECLGDGDCVRDAARSFCVTGLCVGCAGAGGSACAARDSTKPICDTVASVCVACSRDEECMAKAGGPGVCMFHLDGHCASDAEAVYVGTKVTGTCSDSAANAGSSQVPYCTAQNGIDAAKTAGKPVVVMMGQVQGVFTGVALSAPLTVVGKNAVIAPEDYSDGIGIISGEIYLRSLTVAGNPSGVTGIGINVQAAAGATVVLHMDGCTVKDNPGGGILLAGAGFDIRNSTVTRNGPGQTTGGTSWGGIRVESLPAGGQASLDLVTIKDNLAPGLSCSAGIQGQGVLASGNALLDIANSCGVLSCPAPGPVCGAQP